jgi:cystathionine beta-lyase
LENPGFETLCAHAGEDPARCFGAPVPPIYQNSLFTLPDVDAFLGRQGRQPDTYDYSRVANPTTDILEAKLAALEGAETARCFASGMAAVSAALLHCVRAGDHLVAVETCYGPTRKLLTEYLPRYGVSTTFVRGHDPQQFADAIRPETRLIYLESPSSLVFELQDLAAVSALARERGIITAIDNSWASPYFQNPIALGIDLVLHSATKYLGGHSDLVAGVVLGPRERMRELCEWEGQLLGGMLDPFAAWLLLRGVRTLPVRLDRQQQSATAIAQVLDSHPKVSRVHYPGLRSHPQYELGRKQMRGSSGLLSFELKEAGLEPVRRVVDALRYFGIGVSWGGFESLAIPIPIPGPHVPEPGWGIRLHVGLETVDDLLSDLEAAIGR